MLKGFKEFMLKGNVVELAVAVVMGAAFGAVVTAFVKDLLTPLVSAIFGKPSFERLQFTINNSTFLYGDFLNGLVSFLLIGIAVYFVVVVPMKAYTEHMKQKAGSAAPTTMKCPECLSDIPVAAKRCAHCTAPLASQVAAD
jgi:large conductance mechanosensitive channel